MALVAGACSSGGGGSEAAETSAPTVAGTQTVETGSQTVETIGPTNGDAVESDPILSVVTAHDVDEVGVPLEPALEFGPEVPQISVLVRVGEVEPDATLDVAWTWLDGPDGERPLFEHQVDVGAGDVAYSHGVASGPLAAGRYRADVTLGASSTAAVFAVRHTPIVLAEGVAGFARQESTEDPEPPTRGPSGRIPTQHDYGSVAVCTPWVYFSSLLAMTGANGCGDAVGDNDNLLEVTAWVGGNSPFALGQARGDFIKPVQADPCDLGGSDLETEPVSYAVTVISGPDEGEQFSDQGPAPEPDTHAPMAFLASQPLPGAQVNVGDTIVVEVTADDKASVDSVISGIASVTLASDGREVDGLEFTGPEACDKSRLRRVVQLEYVVPDNPPELVTLVATVRDYEGHETTVEASYPTVSLWTGYMDVVGSSVTEVTIQEGAVRCTAGWEFRVVFFARSAGELYGYADGITTAPHECDAPFAPVDVPATRLGISGTMTPDAITLRFEHQSGGWSGIAVLYTPPVPDVIVPRSGAQAFGDIDLTLVTEVPNNTFTENVKGRIDLGCDEC
ncbi:MAG TPA: hypothetical protein VNO51_16555 [Ilumatobacteraceae bacterium]|nr:hypothetical protein [Ilumatobacteraceae bacterium]